MSGDLGVTTAHLRELSAMQKEAAAETVLATEATDGVDSAVRTTHGTIAAATAGAVQAAQQTRSNAGNEMAALSTDLAHDLTVAATQYDAVDAAGAQDLQQQVQQGG
jgi:hypothetical protein